MTHAIELRIPVLWGFMDAMGHVNNTVYFRFFESARVAYMSRMVQLGWTIAALRRRNDERRRANDATACWCGERDCWRLP